MMLREFHKDGHLLKRKRYPEFSFRHDLDFHVPTFKARMFASSRSMRGLHSLQTSIRIVREFDYIAVGNVNAAGLAKTNMAKSVLDAGWSYFRNMLAYKAIKHGAWFEEVNESYTSQICSNCGSLPDSRPKGIADLGIREWVCSDCGAVHDRDINAALNILRRGHATLVEGAAVV